MTITTTENLNASNTLNVKGITGMKVDQPAGFYVDAAPFISKAAVIDANAVLMPPISLWICL